MYTQALLVFSGNTRGAIHNSMNNRQTGEK